MVDITKLNQYITEDRLIRHAWTDLDAQGRETACLLAAMSPEVAAEEDASECPTDIMPQWLAYLTPWMSDEGSAEAWPGMIRRYAAVAARWHVLSDETWRRLYYTARRIALEDYLLVSGNAKPAIDGVIALLRRAEAGAAVAAILASAVAEALDPRLVAAAAAEAAAEGAEAAAEDAWVAWRAAAGPAARAATADRITAAILAAIENACDKAEKELHNECV